MSLDGVNGKAKDLGHFLIAEPFLFDQAVDQLTFYRQGLDGPVDGPVKLRLQQRLFRGISPLHTGKLDGLYVDNIELVVFGKIIQRFIPDADKKIDRQVVDIIQGLVQIPDL